MFTKFHHTPIIRLESLILATYSGSLTEQCSSSFTFSLLDSNPNLHSLELDSRRTSYGSSFLLGQALASQMLIPSNICLSSLIYPKSSPSECKLSFASIPTFSIFVLDTLWRPFFITGMAHLVLRSPNPCILRATVWSMGSPQRQ